MSLLDRLLDTLVTAAAAPLFTPERPLPRARSHVNWASAAQIGATDAAFAVEAMEIGMSAIALSRVAAEKAARIATRDFAQTLITDHGAANTELARLAADKRLTLPLAAGGPVRAHAEELAAMTADALDHAYLRRMVEVHEQALTSFRNQRDTGIDTAMTGFAGRRLGVVEQHLATARHLGEDKSSQKGHKSRKKGG